MKTFAELLAEYMERTGIGDAELARRLSVSRPTIIRWKEGVTARPRYREDVMRCAEVLRLASDETAELLEAAGFSADTTSIIPGLPPSDESLTSQELASVESRKKWYLLAAGVVALLLAAVTVAISFWVRDTTIYPAAGEGESLIITAPFVNFTAGSQGFNIEGRLRAAIDEEIREAGLTGVRTVEWPREIVDDSAAEKAMTRSRASLVIWGEYDSGRVIARFTGPGGPSIRAQQVVDIASSPAELPTTINVQLTGEVQHAALLTLGQLYLEQQEFDQAKSVFIRALEPPPDDPTALANIRFLLARAFTGGTLADFDEAIWLFSQVLAAQPRSVEVLNSRALVFLDRGRSGDPDYAIDDLLLASSIEPDHVSSRLNISVAYLERNELGDADRAIDSLTVALQIQPDYTAALVNRASAYVARGGALDTELALNDLDQALQTDPDLASAHLGRAVVFLARGSTGDLFQAIDELGQAVELSPDLPSAYFTRGLIYSELNDWNASLIDLRRAQELAPRQPEHNSALCLQLSIMGDPIGALPYCDQGVEIEPYGLASDARGVTHVLLGRTDQAIADFETFLEWVDASDKAQCHLHYNPTRISWIAALSIGNAPFDSSTLEQLRPRPILPGKALC